MLFIDATALTSQAVSVARCRKTYASKWLAASPPSRRVIPILDYGYRFAILSRFTDIYPQRAKRVIRQFQVFTRLHCRRFAPSVLPCLKTVCVNSWPAR
jgi:hypothetical protein